MNIIYGIIVLILGFIFIGFFYWIWGFIAGILMYVATWFGFKIGKLFRVRPRSIIQLQIFLTLNQLLQLGIELGLTIWVIFALLNILFQRGWIYRVGSYGIDVALICLFIDLFVLFVLGVLSGKIISDAEKIERIGNE
jgi:hypothetical protein